MTFPVAGAGPCRLDRGTLDAALETLNADKALCDVLGAEFVEIFTTIKRFELNRFHAHVTQWERDEYLELY